MNEELNPTHLRFKLAQNQSISVHLEEFLIPINDQSLAGYVASTKSALQIEDVYELPPHLPFHFNPDFDRNTGYKSQSLLSVPMIDHQDRLIGVVQLWNKKIHGKIRSFTESDQKLLASLSSQAGVAIENARLYEDIRKLFEGLIKASVLAIEARDPTTRGHSERVAVLTVALTQAVDMINHGPYKDVHFCREDIQAIEYAALLHDMGKIGVPEAILIKAKKLYPWELDIIRERIECWKYSVEMDFFKEKFLLMEAAVPFRRKELGQLESKFKTKLKEIDHVLEVIQQCNEPTVLSERVSQDLKSLSQIQIYRSDSTPISLLDGDQLERLSIPKGSLSPSERRWIESHVTHTYQLMQQIPWTHNLRKLPEIAYAHHEKLDGSGYPRGICSNDIPLPSKIMAICDIFDALVASDRPYKKAIALKDALRILELEAKDQKLDEHLVKLFIEQNIFERTTP